MINPCMKNQSGFTLVELLLVTLMMGLVMSAIYTVYLSHQRSAYVQEEVVEVQQNIRVAMENISQDLSMAGFLVPSGTNPLSVAAANSLTINIASERGISARITVNQPSNAGSDTTFTVDSAYGFNTTDYNKIRIIRPQDGSQPINEIMTVNATAPSTVPPTITIGTTAAVGFLNGDMIIRTIAGAANPNTVQYCLGPVAGCGPTVTTCPAGQQCLIRVANGGADTDVIANNIATLQFSYILDNNTEMSAPSATEMSQIRSVRVTITGETAVTEALTGGQAKRRQATSMIKLRNRR